MAEAFRLARAWITDGKGFRTPLHLAADWPGYFPHGPQIVRRLIQAGADPSHPTALTLVTWFDTMPPGSLRGLILAAE